MLDLPKNIIIGNVFFDYDGFLEKLIENENPQVNAAGVFLANFCIPSKRLILNGSLPQDSSGEYTFSSTWDSGVIDYVIVSFN